MILIFIIKFLHVLFAISLLGSIAYCIITPNSQQLRFLNKNIFLLSIVAIITGTLLVYPRGFTFHTPWIQAAYLLTIIFSFSILLLIYLENKYQVLNKRLRQVLYFLLMILLMLVVHDAVTKTTVISPIFT